LLIPLLVFAGVAAGGLAVAAWRLRRSGWNVFDPTATLWLGFALYYGVGNIWFCSRVWTLGVYEHGGFCFDPVAANDAQSLSQVAWMIVVYGLSVALAMFWLGRASLAVRAMGAGARKLASGPDIALALLLPLCVIHWLSELGLIAPPSGFLPSGLLMVPLIGCLALNAKVSYVATQRPSGLSVTIAFCVLTLSAICGAATGMKQAILMPTVASFGGFMLGTRRPWPIAAAISVALPAFVVLQTFNQLSRAVIWDSTAKLSVIQRIEAIGSAAISVVSPKQSEVELADMSRLCTAVPMMQTLELLQRRDGISVLDGLVIPYVPRVLWPDKPAVVTGGTLYEKFTGQIGSSSSPGQPAEAYMYGGWFGVVAVGFGVGAVGAFAGAIVRELWCGRKAACLGVTVLMALTFGKCENWLWTYVPAVLNAVVVLVGFRLVANCVRMASCARYRLVAGRPLHVSDR
jgi:hypothetical protein